MNQIYDIPHFEQGTPPIVRSEWNSSFRNDGIITTRNFLSCFCSSVGKFAMGSWMQFRFSGSYVYLRCCLEGSLMSSKAGLIGRIAGTPSSLADLCY